MGVVLMEGGEWGFGMVVLQLPLRSKLTMSSSETAAWLIKGSASIKGLSCACFGSKCLIFLYKIMHYFQFRHLHFHTLNPRSAFGV